VVTDHEGPADEGLDEAAMSALVARYSTPVARMDPALRQRVEEAEEWVTQMITTGQVAGPDSRLDDDIVPGLDNNYQPYPLYRRGH
jgi:hypothetical protein